MKYFLDHRGKKTTCPSCGHGKVFRGYMDEEGNPAPSEYGICDRRNNCNYNRYPRMERQETRYTPPPPPRRTDWRCPSRVVEATKHSKGNRFAHWFKSLLGGTDALREYRCGTFPKGENYPQYGGAMVYWQVGSDGVERSGKVIQYGEDGKRVKELKAMWMHTVVTKKPMEEIGCAQVYFGTHLLGKRPNDPVAIVESEKSALICSVLYPSHVWIATGGANMISAERSQVLAGRDVTLFPDSGCYEDWCSYAMNIDIVAKSCHVSDIIECLGAPKGEDIADLLLPVNVIKEMNVDIFPPPVAVTEPQAVEEEKETDLDRFLALPVVATCIELFDLDMENAIIGPARK
jgi:hypothetical protein